MSMHSDVKMFSAGRHQAVDTIQHCVDGHLLRIHRHRPSSGGNHPTQVFLVHGLGDTSDTWRTLVDSLPEVEVWTFDLPWSGREGNQWPHRLSATDWWRSAVTRCPVRPDVCIGHSLGAVVLMDWLFDAPAPTAAAPRALMLVSPFYRGLRPLAWAEMNTIAESIPTQLAGVLRSRINSAVTPSASVISAVSEMVAQRIVPDGVLEFLRLLLKSQYWDVRAWDRPTTIIFGEQDDPNVVDSATDLACIMPHAHFRKIQNCGHHPMHEQPHQVHQHVVDLLAGLETDASERGMASGPRRTAV